MGGASDTLTVVFTVRLADFEGTVDLLISVVERRELDPATLPLVEIVSAYLGYVRAEQAADLDALALFVTSASRLMLLKAAAILPPPAAPPPEPVEEPDPEDVEEMLREYRRFKAAAGEFREREEATLRSFPRIAPPPTLPPSTGLSDVTLDRLAAIVRDALARRPPEPEEEVPPLLVTVRGQLAALQAELSAHGEVSFTRFIARCTSRLEVVVGFMAVLELIKSGHAAAEQAEQFGDIVLRPAATAPPD